MLRHVYELANNGVEIEGRDVLNTLIAKITLPSVYEPDLDTGC